MLDHQPLTLLIAIATLVVTVLLYIAIPKGFFPVQDTGMIQAITETSQSVSFDAMAGRQQALADVLLEDQDVVSLSSFIGVDGSNIDAEQRPLPHQLEAARRAHGDGQATSCAGCTARPAPWQASTFTCSRCRT